MGEFDLEQFQAEAERMCLNIFSCCYSDQLGIFPFWRQCKKEISYQVGREGATLPPPVLHGVTKKIKCNQNTQRACPRLEKMHAFVPSNRVAWINFKSTMVVLYIQCSYEEVNHFTAEVEVFIEGNGKSLKCNSGIN